MILAYDRQAAGIHNRSSAFWPLMRPSWPCGTDKIDILWRLGAPWTQFDGTLVVIGPEHAISEG